MYAGETMTREEFRRVRREQFRREQQTRKKRIIIFCVTLIMMFGIGVGFGTILARAEETEEPFMYKYYANIVIEKGDTLWDLAEEYMDTGHYESKKDYINEVMYINHMTTDHLTAGKKIIVPYYSEEIGIE